MDVISCSFNAKFEHVRHIISHIHPVILFVSLKIYMVAGLGPSLSSKFVSYFYGKMLE